MKRLLATTAIVAVMTMPAMAEQHMAGNQASAEQVQGAQYQAGDMTLMVSNLMGRTVYTPEGEVDRTMFETPLSEAPNDWENVADISDILITPEGDISAVVIDAGGFLGMNEKRVRIEMDDLRFVPDEDDEGEFFAVYTGGRQLLEDEVAYTAEDIGPEGTETDYAELSTQDTYARTQGDTLGEGEMTGGEQTADLTDEGMTEQDMTDEQMAQDETDGMVDGEPLTQDEQVADRGPAPDPDTLDPVNIADLTAEDLEGARVYGANNDWVGDVGELVITEEGEITHAVVDVGGFLGIGEKPVAMPFDQVDIRRDGTWGGLNVYVNATEEELDTMERWEG
ncbi:MULTISPECIES: PRC-barrel domain-containing protein [unclassified Roseitalea]|uniref:PRC-barrel domain-containing protein n=1 Tax=unclassified Roseitalea TaxID=2639107 RepID=UPI0027402D4B|nr:MULTISPECIES: PRC-barrel domain-containing protein [unclassified Roseitalea]